MKRTGWPVLVIALFVLPLAVGDTVYLRNGKSVTGTIRKLEPDKLVIQTATGTVEYTREQVKCFSLTRVGPDGKPRTVTAAFKPKPIKMPFELETAHYTIKTDTAEHVCKNTGKAMEQLYKAYTRIFHAEDAPPDRKAEIIIFDQRSAFFQYAQSLNARPRKDTLGFFRTAPDGSSQIVTFKRRTGEFHTLSTLYHEATHQFFRHWLGRGNQPPLWVNEGLAVYFENSRWQNGKLRTGVIPRKRLLVLRAALRAGRHVRLADLVRRGRDRYDGLCYSEGWSLVYFFVKAHRGRYAKRFGKYLRALRDRTDPHKAFKTHLGADLDKLERAWKVFVLGLKIPPA